MRNIKLTIAYDGTRYNGWQKQGNTTNTIQGKLETLLSRMTDEAIEVHGSGRTDAGVHAYGQVANFHTYSDLPLKSMALYIRQYLPEDIDLVDIIEMDERFHSRLNAKSKCYTYRIFLGEHNPVFERKYVYVVKEALNLEAMKIASRLLTGEHDFTSFHQKKRMKRSAVRNLSNISFEQKGSVLEISFEANGFLQSMVRILAGTLIEVGLGKREPLSMTAVITAQNRELAGFTAPAKGLFLVQVTYT